MATIKDIAKAANVSVATVSMALNDKDCITKKTKDKILKIAKEMHYVPSVAAKTLKTNKSKTIALFIGDIANPFFPDIIKGVDASARAHKYSVLMYDYSSGENTLEDEIKNSISQRVDGFFITGAGRVSGETMKLVADLCESGVRIISCNRYLSSDKIPLIIAQEGPQIENLLYKIVAFGHKKIGCISGKEDYWVTKQREEYFKNVLEQFGLYNPDYIINTGFEFKDGRKAARELLTAHPEITALMCVNDTLAIGCATEAKVMGYSVPEDLSIFGVDGIEYLQYHSPEITTVNTHRYEYGYAGTERLIAMIESEEEINPSLLEDMHFPCSINTGATIVAPRTEAVISAR